jgi:hypothetical protein
MNVGFLIRASSVLAAILAGIPRCAAQQNTHQVINSPTKSFSALKGEQVSLEFRLLNSSQEEMRIKSVQVPCGCMLAEFDKAVPAGKLGTVRIGVDTSHYTGHVRRVVTVQLDDALRTQRKLYILGDIRRVVDVLPAKPLVFTVLLGDARTQFALLVSSAASFSPRVAPESTLSYLKTTISPGCTAGGDRGSANGSEPKNIRNLCSSVPVQPSGAASPLRIFTLAVTLDEHAPEGPVDHDLVIETGVAEAPKVAVNIIGSVVPRLLVFPRNVDFRVMPSGSVASRSIAVINNDISDPITLVTPIVAASGLRTRVIPVEEGRSYTVVVTSASPTSREPLDSTLSVRIATKVQKKTQIFEIPLHRE